MTNSPLTQTNSPKPTKHQAYARAYRPQIFSEVVGQEHVLKALRYSLDNNNLHHAYLLTGTRGVGKTTLGRIFARALNCEQGISAEPCGVCSACVSISTGRFVDLIEVDGASNTKVEDTRELLEDVQFVPTQGRFKIYLIDEVHMLSTHSFNALLKTLEEPPEHVKFILATTDPHKLPVTVLSRCLQFHLQLLPVPQIQEHIQSILQKENVSFEARALYLLADAAQGSMRDALTLTDQARSQGQGSITTDSVIQMLGILDQRLAHQLLLTVLDGSPAKALSLFTQIEYTGADSDQILKDLIELCHQVALAQALGEEATKELLTDPSLCESVISLAQQSSPVQIQLCYETLLGARKTLPFASSPAVAVRMALLRMTCFQSFSSHEVAAQEENEHEQRKSKPVATTLKNDVDSAEKKNLDENLKPIEKPIEPPTHTPEPPKQSDTPTQSQHFKLTVDTLERAEHWYEFLKLASPGGLFGQLLYNSRLTQLQQNDVGWKAHLIVLDQIFSYDANETSKAVARMLEKSFNCTFDIQSSKASEIEHLPAQLRNQELTLAQAAFEERLHNTAFITRLQASLAVTLEISST